MGVSDVSEERSDEEGVKPIPPGTFGFGFPGGMSRRGLLAGGGALALGAFLAACGGDDDNAVTATTAGGATTTAAAAATTAGAATTAAPGATTGGSTATTSGGTQPLGTAAPEAKTDTITIGLQSLEEQYVDPHFNVGGLIFPLTWAISDTLYRLDQTAQYVPALATGYEVSDDKLTWTFALRDDVKMHDGSAFTAADVKTAVDRIVQGADFTHLATFKAYVTGATVVDDTHVAVITGKPYATLVSDMPAPIPTAYYNKVGDAAFRKAPMAAGPWKFTSQALNSDVKYDRFDDFWDPERKPNWRKLVYQIVPDESSRVAGVQTGALDIAYGMSAVSAKQFEGDSQHKIVETKETALVYVMTLDNLFPDTPSKLMDVNVRKALLMAIDRDAIGKSLYQGYAVAANSPVPSTMLGFDPSVKALPYDPDKAKQMLAAAGASDLSLTLNSYSATPSIPTIDKLAETLVSLWKVVGVNVTLNMADAGTILPAWRAKQLKGLGLIVGPVYFYYEPSRLALSFFASIAAYPTVIGDTKMDDIVAQINSETDKDKRTALGRQYADLLNTELYGLPLLTASSLQVTGPNVASFETMKGCPYAGPLYWLQAK
jgi:peptide/nickel transport system substrate-binding protein